MESEFKEKGPVRRRRQRPRDISFVDKKIKDLKKLRVLIGGASWWV